MKAGEGSDDASKIVGEDGADEEFIITESCSAEDGAFDEIVGVLEEVAISDEFQKLLQGFCQEHCHHFEDTEENKLIYTEIFKNYADTIEGFLDQKITDAIPEFKMEVFIEQLVERGEDAIDSEMFDLLSSLADFDIFKQQMLAAKKSMSGDAKSGLDLSISGYAAR
mmetsp:Transcript_14932/g.24424  ORF Transcript_14932/g.24424 Transcript_14932/m.24424 type:complete len:167 (-) Transcript_14932:120-620(-)